MSKRFIKMISSALLFFSTMSFAAVNVLKNHETAKENVCSVVILGGGIGALTSGIYLARAGYFPVIVEGSMPGGLITQSHMVENWPGELKISGSELTRKLKSQSVNNGCVILSKEAIDVDFSKKPYVITVKDLFENNQIEKIYADSCIIAMGTSSNYLNVEGEKKYWGRGVSNCAVCDGSFYRNKNVAVIGGGDAAVLEADYLSNLAKKVIVLVRKDSLKAGDKAKARSVLKKNNVEVFYNTKVVSINGDNESPKSLTLFDNAKKRQYDLDIDGIFLAIGSKPNTRLFKNKLDLDKNGYIKINKNMLTSVNDVYAAGDIADPEYKQAITAAGDGAKAAISLQKSLDGQTIAKEERKEARTEKIIDKASVIDIRDVEQLEKESFKDALVIIDFYAPWCGPCKRLSPILESKAKILEGKVKILKVNVEKLPEAALKYQIRAMPAVIVFDREKKVLFKKTGMEDISALLFSLEKIKDKSLNEIEDWLKNASF